MRAKHNPTTAILQSVEASVLNFFDDLRKCPDKIERARVLVKLEEFAGYCNSYGVPFIFAPVKLSLQNQVIAERLCSDPLCQGGDHSRCAPFDGVAFTHKH